MTAVLAIAAPAQAQTYRFQADHVLGTSLDIAAVAANPSAALAAARSIQAEIDRLDLILSGWRNDSELHALNANAAFEASPELFCVVAAAEAWRMRTDGAFDARLGGASMLWRAAVDRPDDAVLAALTARTRWQAPRLIPSMRRIIRPAGVTFDLDGLAKGYVLDCALAAARRSGPDLAGLMIDLGGDVRTWGQAPGGDGWRVGVAEPGRAHDNAAPAQPLRLDDGAVAFSGPGARDAIFGGERFSHILDPATGQAAPRRSAAVFAPTAMAADALATALCAMAPEAGVALTNRLEGMEALVIDADGRRLSSTGWIRLAAPGQAPARLIPVQAGRAPAWPSGFEVAISYEIPVFTGRRIHSPYVAVWVTDDSGTPVRTLSLLGDDLRFVDQNFIWWRRVGRASDTVETIAKPTRRPGRYALVWDGRDDRGARVGQGRYTIHIEATREHGGHSYQSFDLTLGARPATAAAAAETELGASSVRYGPRA